MHDDCRRCVSYWEWGFFFVLIALTKSIMRSYKGFIKISRIEQMTHCVVAYRDLHKVSYKVYEYYTDNQPICGFTNHQALMKMRFAMYYLMVWHYCTQRYMWLFCSEGSPNLIGLIISNISTAKNMFWRREYFRSIFTNRLEKPISSYVESRNWTWLMLILLHLKSEVVFAYWDHELWK
jgi:hypothetical protein